MYNFLKINERKNPPRFRHPLFKKGQKAQILDIKRRPVNNSAHNKKLTGSSEDQSDFKQIKIKALESVETKERVVESLQTNEDGKNTNPLEALKRIKEESEGNLAHFYSEVFAFLKSFDLKTYQSIKRKGSTLTSEDNQSGLELGMIAHLKEIRDTLLKTTLIHKDLVVKVFDKVIDQHQPKNTIETHQNDLSADLMKVNQQIENQKDNVLEYQSNVYSPDIRLNHSEGGESLYHRIFGSSERDRIISNFISPLKRVQFNGEFD